MDKSQSFQFLKLSFIAGLLLITPLLSTSMRYPYLYFLTNLLIIALGAEAGILLVTSNSAEEKKPAVVIAPKPIVVADETSPDHKVSSLNSNTSIVGHHELPECNGQKPKVVEKSVSEKIVTVGKVHKVKKCPSMPSIFFVGGSDPEPEHIKEDEEEEEEAGGLSGQELFTKAETFIGNFYKQLKIQREDSWKRIHGFYQKAF